MIAIVVAVVAAVGFAGAGLLGLFEGLARRRGQPVLIAVAGGILLALAFADLFPEAMELAGAAAVWGFIGGFALLLVSETATRAHIHHSTDESPGRHALLPFVLGLAVHNLADGFVLGLSAEVATGVAGAIGLGIVLHQVPTGLSLAAVLAVTEPNRRRDTWVVLGLAIAIPVGTVATTVLPIAGDRVGGVLLGVAAGVLTYIGAAHLLPETQRETHVAVPAAVFVASLAGTTLFLATVAGG